MSTMAHGKDLKMLVKNAIIPGTSR
jgi:hypothetical protein